MAAAQSRTRSTRDLAFPLAEEYSRNTDKMTVSLQRAISTSDINITLIDVTSRRCNAARFESGREIARCIRERSGSDLGSVAEMSHPQGTSWREGREREREGENPKRGSFRARRIDASRPSERGKVPIRFCREAIKVPLILPREARDKIRLPTALVLPIAL